MTEGVRSSDSVPELPSPLTDYQVTGVPRWMQLLLAAGLFVTFALLDAAMLDLHRVSPIWGSPAGVLCVTQVLLRGNRARTPLVIGTQLGMLAVLITSALTLAELSWSSATWLSLWSWLVGLAVASVIRALRGSSSPIEPTDVIVLLGAVIAVVVPASYLPVLPGVSWSEPSLISLWWAVRAGALMFISYAVFAVIWWFPMRWNADSRAEFPLIAPGVVFSFLTLWAYFNNPELPVTWLVLLPAIWCGMLISPRGVVGYGMATAIAGMSVPILTGVKPGTEGLLPGTVLADLLFVAAVSLSLILSLSRYQNQQLNVSLAGERSAATSRAALMTKVFEGMSDGAVVVSDTFEAQLQNSSARRMLGPLPAGNLAGFLPERGWQQATGEPLGVAGFLKALEGHPVATHLSVTDDEGATRYFEVELSAVGHQTDRVLVLFTDITEQHLKQEELRAFAGVVAHDLRAPLTAVDGWLELLQEALEAQDDASARRALGHVVAGSTRMRRMIEEWLAATAGATRTEDAVLVDLTSLLAEVTVQLSSNDPRDPVIIVATPHVVEAEPILIRQVFANLCSNALKYSRPAVRPVVEITSRLIDGEVIIEVRDNGIGIPEGEQEKIFLDGHRAEAHQDGYVGTGRGLTLVARVVRRFGGKVWVSNNSDGAGSTFFVALPGRLADVGLR